MEESLILLGLVNNGQSSITEKILIGNSKLYQTLDTDKKKKNAPLLIVSCFLFYLPLGIDSIYVELFHRWYVQMLSYSSSNLSTSLMLHFTKGK